MSKLRALLLKHEGLRTRMYKCTAGKWTIGVGRNLEDNGVTEHEAYVMLATDLERIQKEAVQYFGFFKSLDVCRQDVLLSMLFQLGLSGVREFKKMLEALRCQDYEKAADEMLDSEWAKVDTPARAQELAKMMRTGSYPSDV